MCFGKVEVQKRREEGLLVTLARVFDEAPLTGETEPEVATDVMVKIAAIHIPL